MNILETLRTKIHDLIEELGISSIDEIKSITSLTGGVSSDIARIDTEEKSFCVKFALSQLKVAEEWHAPVHRNEAEYEWLKLAAKIAPETSIKLYGHSKNLHGFVMEYLDGDQVYLWKTALLNEQEIKNEAELVGDTLGKIHAASTEKDFDITPFQNSDDFHALRIEPYLLFTAKQYPSLKQQLHKLGDRLYQSKTVLVHGDVSPKNILFRHSVPIILDAECATMGDASFDLAFCLNHLILKAIHLPNSRVKLLSSVLEFWQAYKTWINWEDSKELESRICQLLPALMLARIDGKSPVEYFQEDIVKQQVRDISIPLIKQPVSLLKDLTEQIKNQLETELK